MCKYRLPLVIWPRLGQLRCAACGTPVRSHHMQAGTAIVIIATNRVTALHLTHLDEPKSTAYAVTTELLKLAGVDLTDDAHGNGDPLHSIPRKQPVIDADHP